MRKRVNLELAESESVQAPVNCIIVLWMTGVDFKLEIYPGCASKEQSESCS